MINFGKDALSRIPFKSELESDELRPDEFEIRIASPNGRDIIAVGKKDDLVIKQDYNDNGSIQFLVTGIKYYRSEDVPGDMIFTSEDNTPFGRFQRRDGLYS